MSQFYLVDTKGRTGKSAFDNLRNRAKKTLTTSFESLLTNVQHKRDEVKEAFRSRSGTIESEGGSFSKSMVRSLSLSLNSLPNDKILDVTKLKAFADNKIDVAQLMISVFDREENIVGKGENDGYQHFFLFPQCF